MMTNREMERRYLQMKHTYNNLIKANVELQDENKDLKEIVKDITDIVRDKYGIDLSSKIKLPPKEVKIEGDKE